MAKIKEIPAEILNFKESVEIPLEQLSEVDLESIHFCDLADSTL